MRAARRRRSFCPKDLDIFGRVHDEMRYYVAENACKTTATFWDGRESNHNSGVPGAPVRYRNVSLYIAFSPL